MCPFCKKIVLLGKSVTYISKYTLTTLLSQNMEHFSRITKSVCIAIFEHKGLQSGKISGTSTFKYFFFLYIRLIQIETYPQTLIDLKYSAFCLNNKVYVHRLS